MRVDGIESDRDLCSPTRSRRAPARPPRPDRRAVLAAFAASREHAGLDEGDRELVWVDELLEAMTSAAWTWADLDLEMFEAVLLDGLGWTIDEAPEDPGRVARVLEAFLEFAGREYGAPHAAACCAYLRSPAAIEDIDRWLRPFDDLDDEALFTPLSPPYNWCDGRCARCPLVERCPVGETLISGDPEESRAAALAAAHALNACHADAFDIDEDASMDIDLPPEPPAAARLRQACRDYGMSLLAAHDVLAAGAGDPALSELRGDAMLVTVKGARVASYLSPDGTLDDDAAIRDGMPNLLLIDRIMNAVDRRIAASSPLPASASFLAARDDLRAQLAPLLRTVPSPVRDELYARTLARAAPSPFATRS